MPSAIHALEWRWIPQLAKAREDIAYCNSSSTASVPGMPVELLPATAFATSSGFSVNAHNDSGKRGLVESVLWNSAEGVAPEPPGRMMFFLVEPRIAIDLQCAPGAFLALRSDVTHGTLAIDPIRSMSQARTFAHTLTGGVTMTKKSVTSATEFMQRAYETLQESFVTQRTEGNGRV